MPTKANKRKTNDGVEFTVRIDFRGCTATEAYRRLNLLMDAAQDKAGSEDWPWSWETDDEALIQNGVDVEPRDVSEIAVEFHKARGT